MDRDHFCLSGAPIPLKKDERHCFYCGGYGYVPRPSHESGSRAKQCSECGGLAKFKRWD